MWLGMGVTTRMRMPPSNEETVCYLLDQIGKEEAEMTLPLLFVSLTNN